MLRTKTSRIAVAVASFAAFTLGWATPAQAASCTHPVHRAEEFRGQAPADWTPMSSDRRERIRYSFLGFTGVINLTGCNDCY